MIEAERGWIRSIVLPELVIERVILIVPWQIKPFPMSMRIPEISNHQHQRLVGGVVDSQIPSLVLDQPQYLLFIELHY